MSETKHIPLRTERETNQLFTDTHAALLAAGHTSLKQSHVVVQSPQDTLVAYATENPPTITQRFMKRGTESSLQRNGNTLWYMGQVAARMSVNDLQDQMSSAVHGTIKAIHDSLKRS